MAYGLIMPVIPVQLSFWVLSILYAPFLALLVVLPSLAEVVAAQHFCSFIVGSTAIFHAISFRIGRHDFIEIHCYSNVAFRLTYHYCYQNINVF